MNISRSYFVGLLSACLVLISGCSCEKEKKKKKCPCQEIRINVVHEPRSLDPRKASSLAEVNLARNFMEGLMRINQSGVASNAIAESYTLSKDLLTYTFKLRDSLWSNGDPVTAHDFAYAWKKTLSTNFPSNTAFFLYSIKNAKAVKNGELPASLLGVNATDDHTLVVTLESPTPFFLELLTLPAFFPVNERTDKSNPEWSHNAETFVSNGPFKVSSWEHNTGIQAKKNELYWDRDNVKLNTIAMVMVDEETGFKMYQNGELEWDGSPFSTLPLDALATLESENQIKVDPALGTYWIRTNTSVFPCNSPEIRKALALAIDRESLVEHVVYKSHTPATGIVPHGMGLQTSPYFSDGDSNQAAYLLQVALENEGLTKEALPELTLSYAADTRNHRIAQAVQDQWRQSLGIQVQLEPLESKVYFDRVAKGDFQLACGSWFADFNDPVNFLEIFKTKHVTANSTGWESLDYQAALQASYLATTGEERKETLKKTEEIIMEEMPVIPVFHVSMMHVQNDHLKDVVLTGSGQIDFKWAYVAE